MGNFRISEFEIQAEVFIKLKNELSKCNVSVKGEYKFQDCRFDICILNKKGIIAVIEVKSYRFENPPNYNTKQIMKYKKYCDNVFVIGRLERVPFLIEEIKRIVYQYL